MSMKTWFLYDHPENYPFCIIDDYRKINAVLEFTERFTSQTLFYIIDYFYMKCIDISDAIDMDVIRRKICSNILTFEDIHELIKTETISASYDNSSHMFNLKLYEYINNEDPFDILHHILENLMTYDEVNGTSEYNYLYIFSYLLLSEFKPIYRKSIYPKIVSSVGYLNEVCTRRLIACILADVYLTRSKTDTYADFPKDILKKYKFSKSELQSYKADNRKTHLIKWEYVIDMFQLNIRSTPISEFKPILAKYVDIYLQTTRHQDSVLCAYIMCDYPEIYYKFTVNERYIIWGQAEGLEVCPSPIVIHEIIRMLKEDVANKMAKILTEKLCSKIIKQ